jgi:hypothetical protein
MSNLITRKNVNNAKKSRAIKKSGADFDDKQLIVFLKDSGFPYLSRALQEVNRIQQKSKK